MLWLVWKGTDGKWGAGKPGVLRVMTGQEPAPIGGYKPDKHLAIMDAELLGMEARIHMNNGLWRAVGLVEAPTRYQAIKKGKQALLEGQLKLPEGK